MLRGMNLKMDDKQVVLSVIVPCFNEEEALPLFFQEILRVIESEMSLSKYELIFINDGSRDRTLDIIKSFCVGNVHGYYISFTRNFGKEAAIYAGLRVARGAYVVLMDADLQDPPETICEMYNKLSSGEYDCVATCRTTRAGEPIIRSMFARLFYRLINRVSDVEIVDGARDYRMMTRKMVDDILRLTEYNRFSKGLFQWVGGKTYWLPYQNVERVAGSTKWSFRKLFGYAIEGIVNFSDAPLNLVSGMGMMITVASFIWMLILMVKKIYNPHYNVSGWTSTMCVILFLGGIQLLSIGIIGQYISRIFLETKHRPLYLVEEEKLPFNQ